MRILSFDVGIKNLAMCIINSNIDIHQWEVHQIVNEPHKIVKHLNETFEHIIPTLDAVVVEKQPGRNSKMKIIETILLTYFIVKGVQKVESFSAKHKLGQNGKDVKGKHNYKERKKMAIDHCIQILTKYDMTKDLQIINASKKKDDLSDCFLQALAFCKHPCLNYVQECTTSFKITSRKPTDKQEKKGYSKSNLKYLYNSMTFEDFKKSDKITKAIKRHYKNDINKALEEFSL